MKKIKLLIQYDGTSYYGWQKQPDKPTIQASIEKALEELTSRRTNLTASGRTDRGVHAIGQVAVFKTSSRLTPEEFKKALNSLLPPDIRILKAEDVPLDFNARLHAKKKRYIYLVNRADVQSPFLYRYTYHYWGPLNLQNIKKACKDIVGTKDFKGFQSTGSSVKNTIRTMYEVNVKEISEFSFLAFTFKGPLIVFMFEADGFLKQMVRNIVGTLLEIGKGTMPVEHIRKIFQAGDRKLAGPTVPAHGLFL